MRIISIISLSILYLTLVACNSGNTVPKNLSGKTSSVSYLGLFQPVRIVPMNSEWSYTHKHSNKPNPEWSQEGRISFTIGDGKPRGDITKMSRRIVEDLRWHGFLTTTHTAGYNTRVISYRNKTTHGNILFYAKEESGFSQHFDYRIKEVVDNQVKQQRSAQLPSK